MGPPTDRKEPQADPKISHSGPARQTRALVGSCARPSAARCALSRHVLSRAPQRPGGSLWIRWAPPRPGRALNAPCRRRPAPAGPRRAGGAQKRVWRAGPLCEILGSAPGSLRSVGGPIGPLGCQRAPAGSSANARKPPRQRPKTHREFCPVHCNGFQKRGCMPGLATSALRTLSKAQCHRGWFGNLATVGLRPRGF